ncbi:CsiV family protein [Thiohalophilus thiocyanatoxydans]|uniref:Peptidoglycan-binding protein CsiV n=1 Tax=Thiohalophilus thiocyanatoxydans TaxID=381308 RepID=A0A4R8IU55_9GAMM|nr:CsiV family protein [Thiohalophilus thiocyanatoxydans]TDY02970.1 peptidoglycan-binding protein CsiV [Thiohalophilus thiocyanatoxydans]
MKKYLCLAILALLPLGAIGADEEEVRYYDVELIIFEHLGQRGRESEIWPSSVEQGLPESEVMLELDRPFPGPIPDNYDPSLTFKSLPTSEYRLNDAAKKIEESSTRRVLMHTAWRQPGMSDKEALNVHLSRTIPASAEDAEETETALQGKRGELEAYIRVILSRYLHVDADIMLRTRPETNRFEFFIEEADEPVVYQLKQLRRRIRSTELHYLDHPVLGMLITMHPVETDKL